MVAVAAPEPLTESKLTEVAYRPARGLTFAAWEAEGATIMRAARSSLWWLGDWLLAGEQLYGDDEAAAAVDLAESAGLQYATITGARYVCGAFPPERRRADVSWTHHRDVAGYPPAHADRWLAEAALEGWTLREMRDAIEADRLAREDDAAERAGRDEWEPAQPVDDRRGKPSTGAVDNEDGDPDNVRPIRPTRSITAGYDDSPDFAEACQLRFGLERGAEVATFVREWTGRHAAKMAARFGT